MKEAWCLSSYLCIDQYHKRITAEHLDFVILNKGKSLEGAHLQLDISIAI